MKTKSTSNLKLWLLASMLLAASLAWSLPDRAQQVLIVYNETVPESKPLADYYAQKRGVPTNQIFGVRIRADDTITRREFNDRIREPILRFLLQQGLLAQVSRTREDRLLGKVTVPETYDNKIAFIVLIYGVPLRIDSDPTLVEKVLSADVPQQMKRTEASVDSELTLMPTVGTPVSGPASNPWFGEGLPQFGFPLNNQLVLVARLDGPDAATVRRMIDDALATERDGLLGRAYFDAQGTHDKGYTEGDEWIKASYRLFKEAGFECELDERPELFDEDYPMSDAAVYAGWYSGTVGGPFRRPTFRFRSGAIACHIHSTSAATIHSTTANWVGPLLAKGAAASFGNVYEPYLSLTPHVDFFFKRLLAGVVFAEAGWGSELALSWQTTFVGDPLYRPFARSVDDQISHMELDHNPDIGWAYLRKVNLLLAAQQPAEAEALCRKKAAEFKSAPLYEKLGDLTIQAGNFTAAVEAYKQAEPLIGDSYGLIRLETKLARAHEANGQPQLALAVYEGLISANPQHKNLVEFYKKARDLAAKAGDAAKSRALQDKIDNLPGAQHKDTSK
jgi:uncharacterized protein (TIGR03790 family)